MPWQLGFSCDLVPTKEEHPQEAQKAEGTTLQKAGPFQKDRETGTRVLLGQLGLDGLRQAPASRAAGSCGGSFLRWWTRHSSSPPRAILQGAFCSSETLPTTCFLVLKLLNTG
ncbi:hypothetical protein VULLAG_LOCUS6053 [Vulpes lagopus]